MLNPELQKAKAAYLERVGQVFTDIEFSQEAVDVEGKLSFLIELSARFMDRVHKDVCTDHTCNHSFMEVQS